jgi:hypothetical protein
VRVAHLGGQGTVLIRETHMGNVAVPLFLAASSLPGRRP